MAMTLLESAKYGSDVRRKGVIKLIVEATPILRYLEFKRIKGNAYTYMVESSLPGIAFRMVNETYPNSTHVINPITERLTIMGGEVVIDNFIINTQGNLIDIKAAAYAAKARSLAMVFSEKFFEGNSATNIREFDGLRARLTTNSTITAATNGAALTLAMLDQLSDKVVGMGEGDVHIFINKTIRRKITSLGRDITSGTPLLSIGDDRFGKQVTKWNGIPIHIIERSDDESTFLDFDETTGSSNVTASIYIVRFGDDYVTGLEGEGGSMEVNDFGEQQASPTHMGRIEWYPGLAILNPRAVARLKGITNA